MTETKWHPPETAPKDGEAFIITSFGQQDICWWDSKTSQFRDYYYRQAILPAWPHMVAWRPLGDPAKTCNTEQESRKANGFK